MKDVALFTFVMTLTAQAVFASDHLSKIAAHARDLATDYSKMSVTLKNKNFAPAELKQELQDAEATLAQVRALVAEYGATTPQLNAAQLKDWKLTQDLVALLGIFHNSKIELLDLANAQKKRGELRSQSQALKTRAKMLEAAVLRLSGANTGS